MSRRLAVPIRVLASVLRPIVSILVRLADTQAPGAGVTTMTAVSENELRHLADEAATAGQIEQADAELIDLVVDEDGSTRGIVTVEDLVEELVGTIEDRTPTPEGGTDQRAV